MILKKTQCYGVLKTQWDSLKSVKTSKTTFNNDQPRSGKEKDLWLETLRKKENCLKGKLQYTGLLRRRHACTLLFRNCQLTAKQQAPTHVANHLPI